MAANNIRKSILNFIILVLVLVSIALGISTAVVHSQYNDARNLEEKEMKRQQRQNLAVAFGVFAIVSAIVIMFRTLIGAADDSPMIKSRYVDDNDYDDDDDDVSTKGSFFQKSIKSIQRKLEDIINVETEYEKILSKKAGIIHELVRDENEPPLEVVYIRDDPTVQPTRGTETETPERFNDGFFNAETKHADSLQYSESSRNKKDIVIGNKNYNVDKYNICCSGTNKNIVTRRSFYRPPDGYRQVTGKIADTPAVKVKFGRKNGMGEGREISYPTPGMFNNINIPVLVEQSADIVNDNTRFFIPKKDYLGVSEIHPNNLIEIQMSENIFDNDAFVKEYGVDKSFETTVPLMKKLGRNYAKSQQQQ